MKKSKWMLGAAAMLALSVALAGCGGGDKKADDKAAGVKGSLMVYTSIYPDIIDNMCKPNVAKAFPDMKVNWFQGGTEKVITKITGEIKAKKNCCRRSDGCGSVLLSEAAGARLAVAL